MNLELQKGSRSKILAAILFGTMAVFGIRLFYLQIIRHGYYVDQAYNEQVKRLTIPAKRGLIYGLNGDNPVALVMNQTVYTLFADPQMVKDASKVVDAVNAVAGGNAKSNLAGLLAKKTSRYQVLATRLTRVQADKIKGYKLKGLGFKEMSQRVYPENSLAAQVLGFVDDSGTGQYGVEGFMNAKLAGTDGILQSVTDVSDVPLSIGGNYISKPANDGVNEVLSIDTNVQLHTEQALADGLKRTGATRGSIIVMNPQNGQIMAMANLPTYNPASYSSVTDYSSFNNAVVTTPYEPGSDMKTLTMATGIDKGVVSANSTYNNTDKIEVEDRTISNAVLGHTGNITLQEAMNYSLNTGFVTVAERLGNGSSINLAARETMYDYFYNHFKLGQITGVEVSGEVAGTIISPKSSDGNAVRYSNMAFGQGLDVTMIQVASAFCSLVNGGSYYKPTVLAGAIDASGNYNKNKINTAPSHPVSASTANQIREMTHITRKTLFSVYDAPGYYTGGKTGTSQVIKNGAYSDDETVATYLGYGGTSALTKYVIMVQVSGDHKEFMGNTDAMPIFSDLSNWMLNYLQIKPEG